MGMSAARFRAFTHSIYCFGVQKKKFWQLIGSFYSELNSKSSSAHSKPSITVFVRSPPHCHLLPLPPFLLLHPPPRALCPPQHHEFHHEWVPESGSRAFSRPAHNNVLLLLSSLSLDKSHPFYSLDQGQFFINFFSKAYIFLGFFFPL